MQKTSVLSLTCSSNLAKMEKPVLSEINGELHIWSENTNKETYYDAFNHPELIPELIAMVKKAKQGKDKIKLAEAWVKKWGFLRVEKINNGIGQKLSSFWRFAEDFETAWTVYKYIANRDIAILQLGFKTLEELGELEPYSDDPLKNYQWNGMKYIMYDIERHTKNGIITASEIRRDENKDGDSFTIKPAYHFNDLIDVLYMQFFIALTENKKVCPVCDRPFTPERKDSVYCSSSCKLTAKSQRYRARKNAIIN